MAFGAHRGSFAVAANSITNPFATAGSVSVVAGDLIYAVCFEQTSLTVTGAFDNIGNTYTALNVGTDATTVTGRAFYTYNRLTTTLITASFTCTASADNGVGIVSIFEGPFEPGILLDANPANSSDWTTAFACPATGALSQGQEMVICWSVISTATVQTAVAPNTIATALVSQAVLGCALGFQTVSTTSSVTPSFNGITHTAGLQGTSSFRAATKKPQPKGPYVYQPLIAQ